MRKELGLSISEYIEVAVETDSEEVLDSVKALERYIANEVRASRVVIRTPDSDMYVKTWDIEGLNVKIGVRRSSSPR